MHAHAVENLLLSLSPGSKVLDVGEFKFRTLPFPSDQSKPTPPTPSPPFETGCGSGYLLAIFHQFTGPTGLVLGIEHIPSLVALSRDNLAKSPSTLAALSSNPPSIKVICADGRKGSPPQETPEGGFDAIHVGAAAPVVEPELLNSLKKGGRMFIPVGGSDEDQNVWVYDKGLDGTVTKEKLFGVRYIP